MIVVVSLVKCDPTFGQNKSYLTSLQYTMPIFAFDKNRVHALIPFMYMAKFDPVTSVREIIQSMWEKFVGSEEGLFVKENEQKIIEYLSSNMLNPSWREREAACIALDAILLNKQWFVMKSHMGGLISKGLKVMDDLRESTRKVATNLMKMFFQNILRASNPTESDAETCQTTISMILPILLEKGIVAASVEARGFSLGMLLKLIEQASHMMVPWLIKLIDVFLESISALEPQMLNYIQFHTQSLQMGGEDWEKARLQLSNHTPMHQGLRSCLNLANIDQIPLVCNVAFFHLQSGVGLATRVAAADTLADMAERYPTSMGAHSGKALHSIGIILLERPHLEKSLKKAMLNAFGMLSKVIHVELLVDECFFLLQKYLDHSNKFDDHELAVASCILEVTKRSGDRIQHVQLWNQILSIAYLGSFDAAPEVSKVWSDTFTAALDSSGAGTKLSAIHRCTESLAQYVPYLILDQSWDKRKQAVRVITEMTNNLSAKDISQSYGLIVLSLLLTVPGSLWNGQNQILDALADICKKCPACLSDVEFNSQLNDVGEVIITTSSKDVLKFHVPLVLLLPKDSGYDLEQVKLMQDQIRSSMQDLSRMSDEISDSIVGNAVHWRLNPAILLDLVKIEINRGDLDYRISAANLLASLPWENILSLHPHFLNREFPYLIDLADLHPKAVVSESQSSSTSSSSPGSITAANLVTKKTNNNASFLFGNRYGSVAAPPKPRKTISISSASPSSSSSTAVVSNDEPKVLVESEVGGKDRNLGVTSPAFRMFVVDTIVRCCRVDNVDMSELCNHLDELLQAITEIMKVDAWSMKRSCLQLVSSVASKASLNTAAHLNAVISILEIGASDPKHVKVKVAALEALRTTMQGVNKSVLISSYDERIKVMIRSASLDTQPCILEEASKLQALLLNW